MKLDGVLHIYPQYMNHSPATIRGDVEALTKLREAIDVAIKNGTVEVKMMASDGEGYTVSVERQRVLSAMGEPFYAHDNYLAESSARYEYEKRYNLPHMVMLSKKSYERLISLEKNETI